MNSHTNPILHALFILYVDDQQRSTDFYRTLLTLQPSLNVPGMTEFTLSDFSKIGIMPNKGIAKILGTHTPHPDLGNGIPRCEIYLSVAEVNTIFDHAVSLGVKVIAPPADMDWGHRVCYLADPDGHIIAFASPIH